MKKFTFSEKPTDGAIAHEDKFGDSEPEDFPWQLRWPQVFPPPENDATCKEFGELLMNCVKRGKPITTREYVDFFWKDEDGVYRGGITKNIESQDYEEFVRLVSEDGDGVDI